MVLIMPVWEGESWIGDEAAMVCGGNGLLLGKRCEEKNVLAVGGFRSLDFTCRTYIYKVCIDA